MLRPIRRPTQGIAVCVGICVAGAVGCCSAGGSLMDSVSMGIITIVSVGYTEIRPVDAPELRVFPMARIVGGYGAAICAVGGFVQLITAGEINRALGARRPARDQAAQRRCQPLRGPQRDRPEPRARGGDAAGVSVY